MVRIAAIDPLPLYRLGVASVLAEAGHTVESPADPMAWVRQPGAAVVLLSVMVEEDWRTLHGLCAAPGSHVVIAVVEEHGEATGARAVRFGARSVVRRNAEPELLRHAVAVTVRGQAVMPVGVASLLAVGDRPGVARPASAEELGWLRQLADGTTVARLAAQAGYSERAMFRLLRGLYQRMGVRTRIEAIMLAKQSDWL